MVTRTGIIWGVSVLSLKEVSMQTIKEEVLLMIQLLPDSSTLDEISYHLYVRSKVARGLKAIDEGRYVSETLAEKRINEWSKSFGPSQH